MWRLSPGHLRLHRRLRRQPVSPLGCARTIDNMTTPPELPHPTMGEAVKEALHGLVGEMINL